MKIEVLRGEDKGKAFEPPAGGREVLIGRNKSCHVCLSDAETSRRHARLLVDDRQVILEDLDSTNGTFLNGRAVFRASVSNGDTIRIGDSVLLVSGLPAPAASDSTLIEVPDEHPSIVATLRRDEADLLSWQDTSASLESMLAENRLLRRVGEISRIIAAEQDTDSILRSVLDMIRQGVASDTACVLRWDGEQKDFTLLARATNTGEASALRVSRPLIEEAVREGVAILSTDPPTENPATEERPTAAPAHSTICAPFKIDADHTGLLLLERRDGEGALTALDLRFTATVANLLGVLLQKDRFEGEARQKARLAAVGEVIASVAHYTKNVITGLRFSVTSLEKLLAEHASASVRKCLGSITEQERRISKLVLDMLGYAKDRTPARTKVDLRAVMEKVAEPYRQHLTDESIRFELDAPPELPVVPAEETSLHHAFLNLFTNAMDAFEGLPPDRDKRIVVSIAPAPQEDRVEVSIRDTGCGIPPENLKRIFTAFFSTKGYKGTGLGLAVVQKIIKEHGGTIAVASRENEGTEFRIALPTRRK